MKTLNFPLKFMAYCIFRAVLHPKTQIAYYYCPTCKLRFNSKEGECPKCHDKIENSPEPKQESPVPWYGTVVVIALGIICWVLGAAVPIPGLDEAGHALVYVPLGSLFGMSIRG